MHVSKNSPSAKVCGKRPRNSQDSSCGFHGNKPIPRLGRNGSKLDSEFHTLYLQVMYAKLKCYVKSEPIQHMHILIYLIYMHNIHIYSIYIYIYIYICRWIHCPEY